MIDFSKYSKIYIEYDFDYTNSTNSPYVQYGTTQSLEYNRIESRLDGTKGHHTATLDISNIDDLLVLKIAMLYDSNYPGDGKMTIDKVYLEPTPEQAPSNFVYLYKDGLTYDTITGGWNNNLGTRNSNWKRSAADLSGLKMTLTEINPTSQWSQCGICTKNSIDFSKYSKIYIEYDYDYTNCTNSPCIQYGTTQSFEYANEDRIYGTKGHHTATLDISSINENKILKIIMITSGTTPGDGVMTIHKIYLEKIT